MQWMGEHSPEEVRANMREDQRLPDIDADLQTIRGFQHVLSPDGAITEGSPEIMYNSRHLPGERSHIPYRPFKGVHQRISGRKVTPGA
jgi:hypothetical protein